MQPLESLMDTHAVEDYPREACGVVVRAPDGVRRYVRAPNIHPTPTLAFRIEPSQYLVHGALEAVFHSHPDGNRYPSVPDMVGQVETAVPWRVSVVRKDRGVVDSFWWGRGGTRDPLLGRAFRHGVTDCWALCRDYYEERGLLLPDFPRAWCWWKEGEALYEDNLAPLGFRPIQNNEVVGGSMFVASIQSPTPNHAGVYVGRGLVLQHLSRRGRPYDRTSLSARMPAAALAGYGLRWYHPEGLA